jgi:hypothetical protein
MMEVRIGVQENPKELNFEVNEEADDFMKKLDAARVAEDAGLFWITDSRGRRVAVPADRIAYVELDPEEAQRPVGFGSR